MRFHRIAFVFCLVLALSQCVLGGEQFLLDRGAPVAAASAVMGAIAREGAGGDPVLYLLADGRICPYRWAAPAFTEQPPFGEEIGRLAALAGSQAGQGLLALLRNGQDYQLWRLQDGKYVQIKAGSFGARVIALSCGHFAADAGTGVFLQFDTGKIAYWQIDGSYNCLPIWQNPNAEDPITMSRAGDLDGDGLDELVTVDAKGAVLIRRWRNELWEKEWELPSWGQVLDFDLQQTDAQPGLELAVSTSQKRLFLIGAVQAPATAPANSGGAAPGSASSAPPAPAVSFAIKAKLTTGMVASQIGLLPKGNGAAVISDAAGTISLLLPGADGTWQIEAQLGGGERLTFLTGFEADKLVAVTAAGTLRLIETTALGSLQIYLDGQAVKNSGLYWQDNLFYFTPALLQQTLGLTPRWEEKAGRLTLAKGKIQVVLTVNKTEAMINSRPWPLGHALILVGKQPYVPADLLPAFLVNVTYDPDFRWLILTSAGGA